MKNITLILLLLLTLNSNAQYFEGFETGVPGSMIQTYVDGTVDFTDCGGITGGLKCPYTGDHSASLYNPSNTSITSLETPIIVLSSGYYRLDFDHIQKERWGEHINSLKIDLSTDSGNNYITIKNFSDEIPFWTHEIIYFYISNPDTNTIIRFTTTNNLGYATVLDNISVEEALQVDLGIDSVDIPSIIFPDTNITIEGNVKNYGINTIHSFDLNWQDNDGDINTQNFTGLYITTNNTYDFTHNDIWFVNSGYHELKIWISNINNNGDDANTTNDILVFGVNSPSQSLPRKPLYEEFTSSTCPPCANFNKNYFNQSFLDTYDGYYSLIKYQMNWPSPGDPYYTAEGGVRQIYYHVNGVPSLFLDGVYGTYFNVGELSSHLINAVGKDAYIEISSSHLVTGENIDIDVIINSYLKGNYTLHVVVYEKETLLNLGNNGETHFTNVMMKMIPNANGTPISLEVETPQSFNFNVDLSGTNVEEFNDLGVVVFIQDDINKMMMQSTISLATDAGLPINRLSNTQIYPNPTKDIINIKPSIDKVFDKISVYSFQGVLVKEVKNANTIDLTNLKSGIYLLKYGVDDIYNTQIIMKDN